jgi:murein L,D-transpeptidase YafK
MVVLNTDKIYQKTGSTRKSTIGADKVGVKRREGDKRSRGGRGKC